jgi:hypothetical protein
VAEADSAEQTGQEADRERGKRRQGPHQGIDLREDSLLKTSAAAVRYGKKSYHSMAVQMKLARATLDDRLGRPDLLRAKLFEQALCAAFRILHDRLPRLNRPRPILHGRAAPPCSRQEATLGQPRADRQQTRRA